VSGWGYALPAFSFVVEMDGTAEDIPLVDDDIIVVNRDRNVKLKDTR
jgi:hypothetical protein